jgi:uncharacterized protein (DUF433 family)
MEKINYRNYIHSDQDILLGKPVIKGTRISVEFLLDLLASGWTEQMIFENYPGLTQEHLKAVFAFMSDCFQDGFMYLSLRKSA